jgi:hypothetical protein
MKGFLKVAVGAAVMGVILYKFPIMEIATLFFYVVFIPLVFLSGIGLIGSGVVDLTAGTFNQFQDTLRKQVAKHRQNLSNPTPETKPSPEPVQA